MFSSQTLPLPRGALQPPQCPLQLQRLGPVAQCSNRFTFQHGKTVETGGHNYLARRRFTQTIYASTCIAINYCLEKNILYIIIYKLQPTNGGESSIQFPLSTAFNPVLL